MAWWKHATQRGGLIAFALRSRATVRNDGCFQAPDDARVEARLEAAGHIRLDKAPPKKDAPPAKDARTEKQKRSDARRARRAAKPPAAAAGDAPPAAPSSQEAAGPSQDQLREVAAKHGVSPARSNAETVARLEAAGVDVAAEVALLAGAGGE